MQAATEAQAPVTISSVPILDTGSVDAPMEVDHPAPERGTKRVAEDETPPEPHKKARIGKFCIIPTKCLM